MKMAGKIVRLLSVYLVLLNVNLIPDVAHAQSAGSTVVSVGWARIMPLSNSDPLTVTSLAGHPVNQVETGTSGAATSTDTVGLVIERYITDNIGVAVAGGFPAYLGLEGRGTLGKYGQIGKARPWAPQVILRYHFLPATSKFRPFAGIGVNYTWFTNVRVNNQTFVTQSFGPGSSANASASSSWNPVFELGANYQFDKHWAAGFSFSYIPASTNVTLTGHTATGVDIVSKTRLRLRPITTFLNVSYIF
ncbi:OmpW family protein [Paraburkholderia acidicola]|uniref:OmpW family protein n=2 Tax=Paraburkholderia acidicola TaxID=1912599 RepID=A0ABV1LJT7_9BURK